MKKKISLDIFMACLLLFAMAFRVTGDVAHEFIGVTTVGLIVIHNFINRRRYINMISGEFNARKVIQTVLNILLLAAIVSIFLTGTSLSKVIFPFIKSDDGFLIKRIHTFAAYWLFILISIHIGIHWQAVMKVLNLRITKFAAIAVSLVAVIAGVYASIDREVGARLIMYYSFDFWDKNSLQLIFIISNLSIMGLYIFIAHHMYKIINKRKEYTKKKQKLRFVQINSHEESDFRV